MPTSSPGSARSTPFGLGLPRKRLASVPNSPSPSCMLSGCTTASDHTYIWPNGSRIDDQLEAASEIGVRFHASRGSMSVGESAGGLPPDAMVEDEAAIIADSMRLIEALPRSPARRDDPDRARSLLAVQRVAGPDAREYHPRSRLRRAFAHPSLRKPTTKPPTAGTPSAEPRSNSAKTSNGPGTMSGTRTSSIRHQTRFGAWAPFRPAPPTAPAQTCGLPPASPISARWRDAGMRYRAGCRWFGLQ